MNRPVASSKISARSMVGLKLQLKVSSEVMSRKAALLMRFRRADRAVFVARRVRAGLGNPVVLDYRREPAVRVR